MRGEETQIVGGVDEREERVLVALPGTHSKWACVDVGPLVDFMTFMTGEMWDVLLTHSILGRLADRRRAGGRHRRRRSSAASRAASVPATSRTTRSARARWR